MTNKTPLDMDDLDARSHDIDDAKADDVSGGFFSPKLFAKTASGAAAGKSNPPPGATAKAFGKGPKVGPKPPR